MGRLQRGYNQEYSFTGVTGYKCPVPKTISDTFGAFDLKSGIPEEFNCLANPWRLQVFRNEGMNSFLDVKTHNTLRISQYCMISYCW